jgi:single-strand DNA-binding protein
VVGRLHVWVWECGEKWCRSVALDATAIGHDLSWGKSSFTRSIQSAAIEEASFEAASGDEAEDEAPTDAEIVVPEFEELPVPF